MRKTSPKSITQQHKLYRRYAFIGLNLTMAVLAVLDMFILKGRLQGLLHNVIGKFINLFLLITWCRYDSFIHKYRLKFTDKLWIILFNYVGVPLYFWKTRSWKEFLKSWGGLHLIIVPALSYLLIIILADALKL